MDRRSFVIGFAAAAFVELSDEESTLLLGQARGAAICGLVGASLPVAEYTALQVKKAVVGQGKAQKSQVQAMVQRLLQLDGLPGTDAADALGLPHAAHIHCNNLGLPGNWSTTKATMEALEGRRAHLTHIQFHSYGTEGDRKFSSGAARIAGQLIFVDNAVDRSSGTIHARATIPNSDLLMTPGGFARVRLAVAPPVLALLDEPFRGLDRTQPGRADQAQAEDGRIAKAWA